MTSTKAISVNQEALKVTLQPATSSRSLLDITSITITLQNSLKNPFLNRQGPLKWPWWINFIAPRGTCSSTSTLSRLLYNLTNSLEISFWAAGHSKMTSTQWFPCAERQIVFFLSRPAHIHHIQYSQPSCKLSLQLPFLFSVFEVYPFSCTICDEAIFERFLMPPDQRSPTNSWTF